MFSVAMNQPQYEPGDLGFDIGALVGTAVGGLISAGGQFASAKIQTDAIKRQIEAQTAAQRSLVEAEAAATAQRSMAYVPLLAVGAVALYFIMKRR